MMYSSFGYGHGWGNPWLLGMGSGFAIFFGLIAIVLLVAFIALKGYALWSAAKRDEKWWFIAILILNTLGILEIIYIVFFVKQWHKKVGNQNGTHDAPKAPGGDKNNTEHPVQ
jgi:hypothetical protein